MLSPGYAIRLLSIVLLQAISLVGNSQRQNLIFEHFGTERGLSQNNVTGIMQDSRGFMWFGTREGLNKYDGYNFTIYRINTKDRNKISNNTIKEMVEDQKGNIWMATQGDGLQMLDREKDSIVGLPLDGKNDVLSKIIDDSRGNLWLGTAKNGLCLFDRKTQTFIYYAHRANDPKSISNNTIVSVFEDSEHNLWVGTPDGLNLFNRKDQTFTCYKNDATKSNSISSSDIRDIFEDSKHQLWIGGPNGLNLLDKKTGEFKRFQNEIGRNSLSNNIVMAIREDAKGYLWIGTQNGGLCLLDPKRERFYTYKHESANSGSLSDNSIYSICKDLHGDMWVGTFTHGVDLVSIDINNFNHYKSNSTYGSLSNNSVLSFCEDAKNDLWISTDGGGIDLFDRKKNTFIPYKHENGNKNSISGDYVIKIIPDHSGNLWMGTWADGITVFNKEKNTFKHIKNNPNDPHSLSSNNVITLFEDSKQNIWIGAYTGGLNLYNPKKDNFTRIVATNEDPGALLSPEVNSIFEDDKGNLWVGVEGAGLCLLNKDKKSLYSFKYSKIKNSISNDNVLCIMQDRNKMLWVGTRGGLNRFDKEKNIFKSYHKQDGLPGEEVYGILEDDRGNLWLSTNKGLSRFNMETGNFKNFTDADGLQSNEFTRNAFYKSRTGAMYFGGANGFNEFYPDSIKLNSFDPPLVITGFQIFNKEVPISRTGVTGSVLKKDITDTRELSISYKESVFSFEFASLNYTSSGKKQYAYRMSGFDNDWNYVGTAHSATYTNLDPGDYSFEVKGLNNNGSWSPSAIHLKITITPPFWKTWWFRSLAAFIFIASLIGFYRIRMSSIKQQKKDLERQVEVLDKAVAQGKFEIASDVLHDIGNAMVGFGSYLTRIRRLLDQDQPENLKKLASLFEARHTAMATALGEDKAGAVVKMLAGIAHTQMSNLAEIKVSITEQLNIITHIQEILHIQRQYISGKETQERKLVDLRAVINDCLSMLFSSIDKSAIAVSLDMPEGLPLIKGDRTKLMQVVLTILKNSLEAIDPEGTEKLISIRSYLLEDQLTLEVLDSGSGFDESTGQKLFTRGFTTKFSGAGLGLYNCLAIMESHEGSIFLSSKGPGQGALTTIKFKLPSTQKESSPLPVIRKHLSAQN